MLSDNLKKSMLHIVFQHRQVIKITLKLKIPLFDLSYCCTLLMSDTPCEFLTASLWAWWPLSRQAHKDAVRNPQGMSDLSYVQPRAAGYLFFLALRSLRLQGPNWAVWPITDQRSVRPAGSQYSVGPIRNQRFLRPAGP